MNPTPASHGLVAQAGPAPEVFGVAIVLGVVIGTGMAYHAHTGGRSWLVWGLVGFFLGIFGLLIYLGYLVVSPQSTEEEHPGPDVAGPADTRTPPASTAGTAEPTDGSGTSSDGDNQWRQVASELGSRGGGPGQSATSPDAGGPGRQSGAQQRGTERSGTGGGARSADRQPDRGSEAADTGGGTARPSGRPEAERAGMAVELTYGDGQSDLLSGVTHIERDDRALVVTREDGTERRYENGRVERVWDESE